MSDFDPLESRNAHFNLNKLGAVVIDYQRDAYSHSQSKLHEGFYTDRFVLNWDLTNDNQHISEATKYKKTIEAYPLFGLSTSIRGYL